MQLAPLRTWLIRHEEKVRFLFVGGWNTAVSLLVLWLFERLIPYGPGSALAVAVGIIAAKQIVLALAWVVTVTQNLFSFKLLVFRTKGHWIREYARMYVTYAGTFLIESVMIQVISGSLGWSLVWSKLPTLVVTTVLSYLGHKYFTFRTAEQAIAEDLDS